MVFTLPPIRLEEDPKALTRKIPKIDTSLAQGNDAPGASRLKDPVFSTREERTDDEQIISLNIFDLPLYVIIQNIANTLLLILSDLTDYDNYSNLQNFLQIFLVENRLLYLGLFIIIIALFTAIFFK
jgi:hypothetical protein